VHYIAQSLVSKLTYRSVICVKAHISLSHLCHSSHIAQNPYQCTATSLSAMCQTTPNESYDDTALELFDMSSPMDPPCLPNVSIIYYRSFILTFSLFSAQSCVISCTGTSRVLGEPTLQATSSQVLHLSVDNVRALCIYAAMNVCAHWLVLAVPQTTIITGAAPQQYYSDGSLLNCGASMYCLSGSNRPHPFVASHCVTILGHPSPRQYVIHGVLPPRRK
jgi:hypothetical protein